MADEREALNILGEVMRLLEQTPGAAPVLDDLRKGRIDPMEAIKKLTEVTIDAGHGEALVAASSNLTDMFNITVEQGEHGRPVVMKHDNNMTMLNPIMEAAIGERASIDGDVPELRVGPIPDGGFPAVPVLTDSHDPVFVGMQLKQASSEVQQEIKLAIEGHSELCRQIMGRIEDAVAEDMRESALEVAKKNLPAVPVGVKGYEAGKKPRMRKVLVNPQAVATLNKTQRREHVYLSLATTQGRESLSPVIEKGIIDYLRSQSVNAVAGRPHKDKATATQWVMEAWGAQDLSDGFNPITTAIRTMAEQVVGFTHSYSEVCVEVAPYHGVADRRFGWTLVVGPKE